MTKDQIRKEAWKLTAERREGRQWDFKEKLIAFAEKARTDERDQLIDCLTTEFRGWLEAALLGEEQAET